MRCRTAGKLSGWSPANFPAAKLNRSVLPECHLLAHKKKKNNRSKS